MPICEKKYMFYNCMHSFCSVTMTDKLQEVYLKYILISIKHCFYCNVKVMMQLGECLKINAINSSKHDTYL